MGHVRGGMEWVMQGWGRSCRVGWVMQGWGGLCRGGMHHRGVEWAVKFFTE